MLARKLQRELNAAPALGLDLDQDMQLALAMMADTTEVSCTIQHST